MILADKNNNGIPDKHEYIATYVIAGICLLFAFLQPEKAMSFIGMAAALSGLRDWKSK